MKPTDDEEISKMNSEENSTFNNNNNNNTTSVDFIEMLTLDAKEFLTIKCVCDAFSESSSFCRECFQNFKNSLNNNFNNVSHKINEPIHMIRNSDAVSSCEANEPNNELLLLNAKEIDIIKTNGIQKSDYKTNNCWDKKNAEQSGEQETVSNECCKKLNETNNSDECKTVGGISDNNKMSENSIEENNCSIMEQEIIIDDEVTKNKEAVNISIKSAKSEITKPSSSSSLTHTNQELLCTILKALQGSSAEDLAENLGKIVKHLEKSELQISSSAAINLDPKNELNQRNSSEISPSSSNSSSSHYQEPTYRESCASPESIDADGRFLEAPICSLKTDVDVFSVSVEHPLSKIVSKPPLSVSADDCSSAGASIKSLFSNSSSEFTNEKNLNLSANKDLSWSFKNGRLVFVDDDNKKESSSEDEVKKLTEPPVSSNETIHNNNISSSSTDGGKLSSKEINRRINEDGNSRLKYLEDKLKKAGITDTQIQKDSSITIISSEVENKENFYQFSNPLIQQQQQQQQDIENSKVTKYEDFNKKDYYYNNSAKETQDKAQQNNNNSSSEGEDLIPDGSHDDICQFNVKEFASFNANNKNSNNNPHSLGIYDEFINDSSDDDDDGSSKDSCECDDDEDHFIVIRRVPEDAGGGTSIMVNDNSTERSKHNPDRNNLKPLLKKPGRTKSRKSNRVIFNETKNEFFDADYIILIREDCELDDDDDDGICTCQQHEMVRLTCCEPNCNCQYDNVGGPAAPGPPEQTPQSPKFAPPIEFVDAVTLSPPEGYKDMELLAAAAAVSIRGQPRAAICRECSAATHDGIEEDEEEEEEGDAYSQSDSEMDGQIIKEQEEKEKTDQSQQTTPTTPPSIENGQNYNILENLNSARIISSSDQKYLKEFVETENNKQHPQLSQGSPISGILKGGRLWKQQNSVEVPNNNTIKNNGDIVSSDSVTSDEETGNKRSVRFIESGEKEKRVSCDGAPEVSPVDEENRIIHQDGQKDQEQIMETYNKQQELFTNNSPEGSDLMLTFKLGNHVLISNNSLKPNSAVRQLFPCTKNLASAQAGVVVQEEENSQQYLVTAESLRAFEEAKRAKLPQIIQSGEADETIKRAIERNTLRRSLIRYEPKSKKQPYKSDNSLVERIKMLTCDVDNSTSKTEFNKKKTNINTSDSSEDVPNSISRFSPPGEEAKNSSSDANTLNVGKINQDKSFSPSSSSTASSSSSASLNQNYQQMRKLSATSEQLLIIDPKRMENMPDIQNNFRRDIKPLPDIGGPHNHDLSTEPTRAIPNPPDLGHCIVSNKLSSSSANSESRRQFLSTLAPLTACVAMGVQHNEDYYYHLTNHPPGERISVASSGTEYSLEDIDEGLKNEEDEQKRIAPDVLVGTPSASESGDELAMFVQQDAGRMERIKKKYQPLPETSNKDHQKNNDEEDDENDDYGFNRRPNVRGIKPRFSTTTEILQQIQNQLQAPTPAPPPPSTKVAWPYYSESGLATDNNAKQKTANSSTGNYHYVNVGEDTTNRVYPPQQYRPTSLQEQDNNLYQNCTNQRCLTRDVYQRSTNTNVYSSVIRMGNDYYQTLPLRQRVAGRPQSPPPMEMSKQYHQTMVYIPYNHIEGYQPSVQQYYPGTNNDYAVRVSSQNQINKRYVESIYQSRQQQQHHHHAEDQHQHYNNSNVVPPIPPKTMNRVAYPINNGPPPPPSHIIGGSRSDSPQSGQFSTSARSTQTMSSCGGYYPPSSAAVRFRPMVGPTSSSSWSSNSEGNYAKMNRHSFPSSMTPRYPTVDNVSLTDSDSQHSAGSIPNGFRQSDISMMYASKDCIPNSPTKSRFIERGVPEGAASVSPQDISGVNQLSSSSTMTSPTSPQNPVPTNQNNKPMFYAMNV